MRKATRKNVLDSYFVTIIIILQLGLGERSSKLNLAATIASSGTETGLSRWIDIAIGDDGGCGVNACSCCSFHRGDVALLLAVVGWY